MASVIFRGSSRRRDPSTRFRMAGFVFPKDEVISDVPEDVVDQLKAYDKFDFEIGEDVPREHQMTPEERHAKREAQKAERARQTKQDAKKDSKKDKQGRKADEGDAQPTPVEQAEGDPKPKE